MAINAGVNTSKLISYALTSPANGVDASKLIAYALTSPPVGVDVSKIIAYAILTQNVAPVWPTFSMPAGFLLNTYYVSWDLVPATPPTTYSIVSGSMPPGLALANISGDQGSISGTPTSLGSYTFTLRATNTFGTADKTFVINVLAAAGSGGAFTYAG